MESFDSNRMTKNHQFIHRTFISAYEMRNFPSLFNEVFAFSSLQCFLILKN